MDSRPESAGLADIVRFIATPTGFLMVLRQGDDVIARLEALMEGEKIPSASFVGLGFAASVTFGFYDLEKRDFDPKTFVNVEITSLTGTLAWKEGKPSIHAHATAGDSSFATVGGHVLGLEVGTGSMEITVLLHDKRLERFTEPAIGANVLGLA